jgi:hypothetical protein
MGTHLLCLESITHHNFQFGLEGFKCLLPSMVHALPFFSTNFSRIWPTMNFFSTSLPPLWYSAPCPSVDKGHQTIATSLWLNPKFCSQTILEILWKFETWCITRIHLVLPKNYASMTYLYFSMPILWLFTKALSRYAIVCSIKNVRTIFWNFHVANPHKIIVFKLLMLLGLCRWSFLFAIHFRSPSLVHSWRCVIIVALGLRPR